MSDVFNDSVRTIARTEIIENKIDSIKEAVTSAKNKIGNQRIAGYQNGTGGTDIASGAIAGASGTAGTGNDGSPVLGPLAPPPVATGLSNALTSSLDAAKASQGLNNTATQSNDAKSNDLSDKATDPKSGGGGINYNDQGTLGEQNPDWLKIKDAMIANGATDEQIGQARRNFLKTNLGIDEIGDVVKGEAGPKPIEGTTTNWSFLAPRTDLEVINGFVGVDPDNHDLAVVIHLDGVSFVPSITDSENNGMGEWEDANTPPILVGYEAGYYWTSAYGNSASYTGWAAQYLAALKIGYPDQFKYYLSYDPTDPDDVNVMGHWTPNDADPLPGDPPPVLLGTVTRGVCSGVTAYCPIAAPREAALPLTGSAHLDFVNGHLVYSVFDSELPAKYKGVTSSAVLHSMVTDQDYYVEPGINGGYVVYDTAGADGYLLYFNSARQLVGPRPMNTLSFYKPRSQ